MVQDQTSGDSQQTSTEPRRGLSRTARIVRQTLSVGIVAYVFLLGLAGLAAADPQVLIPLQTEFCGTPFIGDTLSWFWPIATKTMMAIGGLVFLYGVVGPASEGRGRLSMGQAIFLGVALFFVGFQWEPMWTYIGGIYGEPGGNINALTCGM